MDLIAEAYHMLTQKKPWEEGNLPPRIKTPAYPYHFCFYILYLALLECLGCSIPPGSLIHNVTLQPMFVCL